jgi:ATP-dependent DNA helicase PIF1
MDGKMEDMEDAKMEDKEELGSPAREEDTLSAEQKRALQAVLSGRNVFITGSAGTGKSYLIRLLVDKLRSIMGPEVAVTASTGNAAHNLRLGARTPQSLFCFFDGCKNAPSPVWNAYKVLLIDECSMITRADFETMNSLAQTSRGSKLPFGGLQLILVGDFLQLPPVASPVVYIFETDLWKELCFTTVMLTTPFRQPDPLFSSILNRIRVGAHSREDVQRLMANVPARSKVEPTHLFTQNERVSEKNTCMLTTLQGDTYRWDPDTTDVQGRPAPVDLARAKKNYVTLELRVGAQVMLTVNMSFEDGLVNGSRGVVLRIEDNAPVVLFENGRAFKINAIKQVCQLANGSVTVVHVPLVLAWAMSIHKSQGQSLDSVFVSGRDAFAPGQIYVALSRARSLKGLKAIELNNIKTCPKALEFYRQLKGLPSVV